MRSIARQYFSQLLLTFLSVAVFGCAHVPAKIEASKPATPAEVANRRTQLIGKWYSEIPTKDGGLRKSLMERRPDGTYTVKFQLFKDGKKTMDQVEAGIWGVSGNIYFTATREMLFGEDFKPVPTTDPTYYDAYAISKLDDDVFTYVSLDMQDEFTVRRAAKNFKLQ